MVFRSSSARPEIESRLIGSASMVLTGSGDGPFDARCRNISPSVRYMDAADASHSRAARSAIASSTGCTSVGELEMTRRISATAVCCSSASFVALKRRTFSIAIAAWSAKVFTRAICLSVNARASMRQRVIAPMARSSRIRGTERIECEPVRLCSSRPSGNSSSGAAARSSR